MLTITIPAREQYDEINNMFISTKEQTICLEHSLVALSKWESKWCKPFLKKDNRTDEEAIDYIRCMTLTQNVDPNVYKNLTADNIKTINNYIESPMTATWFPDDKQKKPSSREIITAEIIYYWMIALNIPFECQKWHLNRLMTLIRVCNAKNSPPKKMTKRETIEQTRALNEARRKAMNSNG